MENENITVAEVPSEFQQQPIQNQFDAPPQVEEVAEPVSEPTLSDLIAAGDLTKIPINNENVSLNVIVAFLNQASRRGAFSIEENAKIWECIKLFVQPSN
jgi:hypothetical protein